MKKTISVFMLLCVLVISGTNCYAAKKNNVNVKTSFAIISDAKFNKKKLKKNNTFNYSFKISLRDSFDYESEDLRYAAFDRTAPYYYVTVCWKSSKAQQITQTFKWKSSKKKNTIKGEIPVYTGMQTGKWRLDYIQIRDSSPNEEDSTDAKLYISHGGKRKQKLDDSSGYAYRDLSFANFTVKGKRKADKKAPAFNTESLFLSKNEVKSGEEVTFSVNVKDASEVQMVTATWIVTSNYSNHVTEWDLNQALKYNKRTKRYECKLVLNDADLQVRLVDIYTQDIYGNSKLYTDWCESECEHGYKSEFHDAFSKIIIYKK